MSRSPHRQEIEDLLRAGWSSLAIERYLLFRYGEDIPASTIRTYRSRKKIEAIVGRSPLEGLEPDSVQDVLSIRSQLIQLQQARIAVDWKHEQSMSKLFGSTKGEIAALSALLDAHKADLQDLGVFPKAGTTLTVQEGLPVESGETAPRARTLGELVGQAEMDPAAEMALARVLHLADRKTSGEKAG